MGHPSHLKFIPHKFKIPTLSATGVGHPLRCACSFRCNVGTPRGDGGPFEAKGILRLRELIRARFAQDDKLSVSIDLEFQTFQIFAEGAAEVCTL